MSRLRREDLTQLRMTLFPLRLRVLTLNRKPYGSDSFSRPFQEKLAVMKVKLLAL